MTEITSTHTQKHPAVKVSGRRLLAALGIGFGAGAVIGTITYYAIHLLLPAANSSVTAQLIVVEVYALLTGALAVAFRPVGLLDLNMHPARSVARALRKGHGGHNEQEAKLVRMPL